MQDVIVRVVAAAVRSGLLSRIRTTSRALDDEVQGCARRASSDDWSPTCDTHPDDGNFRERADVNTDPPTLLFLLLLLPSSMLRCNARLVGLSCPVWSSRLEPFAT
jgi:hypothetical protein